MNAADILAVIFLIITGLFILVGNIFVFIAVLKDNKLRNKSNAFILCLAGADLMVAIFNIPLTIASVFLPKWRGQDSDICKFSGFFEMLFLVASVQSLGIIGINRFYYVVHWKTYHDKFTKKRVGIIILGVWVLSVILCIPPFLGWGEYGYKQSKNHCFVVWRSDIAYTYFMVFTCFMGPMLAMGICYYRIFKFNRQRKKRKWSWLQKRASPAGSTDDILNTDKTTHTPSLKLGKGKATYKVEDATLNQTSIVKKENKTLPVLRYAKSKSVSFKKEITEKNPSDSHKNSGSEHSVSRRPSESTNGKDHKHVCTQDSVASTAMFVIVNQENDDDSVFTETATAMQQPDQAANEKALHVKEIAPDIRLYKPDANSYVKPEETVYQVMETEWTTDTDISVSANSTESAEISNMTTSTDITVSKDDNYEKTSPKKPEKRKSKEKCRRSTDKRKFVVTVNKKKNYSPQISKEERKLSFMLALMVIIFIIAWLPFVITMFLEFYTRIEIITELDRMALFIGYSNSLCNPIIYGLMNQRFRKVYKEIFCLIIRCGRVGCR